jgi:hypothetical protein
MGAISNIYSRVKKSTIQHIQVNDGSLYKSFLLDLKVEHMNIKQNHHKDQRREQ